MLIIHLLLTNDWNQSIHSSFKNLKEFQKLSIHTYQIKIEAILKWLANYRLWAVFVVALSTRVIFIWIYFRFWSRLFPFLCILYLFSSLSLLLPYNHSNLQSNQSNTNKYGIKMCHSIQAWNKLFSCIFFYIFTIELWTVNICKKHQHIFFSWPCCTFQMKRNKNEEHTLNHEVVLFFFSSIFFFY